MYVFALVILFNILSRVESNQIRIVITLFRLYLVPDGIPLSAVNQSEKCKCFKVDLKKTCEENVYFCPCYSIYYQDKVPSSPIIIDWEL